MVELFTKKPDNISFQAKMFVVLVGMTIPIPETLFMFLTLLLLLNSRLLSTLTNQLMTNPSVSEISRYQLTLLALLFMNNLNIRVKLYLSVVIFLILQKLAGLIPLKVFTFLKVMLLEFMKTLIMMEKNSNSANLEPISLAKNISLLTKPSILKLLMINLSVMND